MNLVHHIRKPPGGLRASPDDMMVARGAGSMLGEAHFVFNLTDMSKRDAEEMGVEEDDLRSYLRLDDAKTKMGPPNDARWFERHGEDRFGNLVPKKLACWCRGFRKLTWAWLRKPRSGNYWNISMLSVDWVSRSPTGASVTSNP